MKKFLGCLMFMGALLGLSLSAQAWPAHKQASDNSQLTTTDRTFVREAAQGGIAEVELGKLAETKAVDPAVKEFGRRMVRDHSEANAKLQQTAQNMGISLPSGLSAKDQSEKTRLENLSGTAFDRAYMDMMVRDHRADIAEFQREANNGQSEQLKAFASQTLPVLQDHLNLAQNDLAKIGSRAS